MNSVQQFNINSRLSLATRIEGTWNDGNKEFVVIQPFSDSKLYVYQFFNHFVDARSRQC